MFADGTTLGRAEPAGKDRDGTMPNRILREAILDSGAVDRLTAPAEVFYRRLMSVVDDFGRFDARPSVLKARCYPLKLNAVREADISRWTAECAKAGLIALYSHDDKPYLLFLKLGDPRAKTSKFPAPPADAGARAQTKSSADTCAQTRPYSDSSSPTNSDSDAPTGVPLPAEIDTAEFRAAWDDWGRHRREIRKPLTPMAKAQQLQKLVAMGGARAVAALRHSMANGWQGVFEPDGRGRRDLRQEVIDNGEAFIRAGQGDEPG